MRRFSSCLVLATITAGMVVTGLDAQRTLLVPGQYATIQRALDATGVDDTVLVAPGRYAETIVFPSNANGVTLKSAAGAYLTTIDGNASTVRVVAAYVGANCTIDGFTITGGAGGGMALGSSITVQNCIITGCVTSRNGGGITVWGPAVIRDNIIVRNHAKDSGGGIYFPGIRVGLTVTGNVIADNIAGYVGGGIFADSSHLSLFGNRIERNRAAHHGGGVFCQGGSTMMLGSNVIAMNTAGGDGGGLAIDSFISMTDSTILGNVAGARGGGFLVDGWGTMTVTNLILWGNKAASGASAYVTDRFSSARTLSISYSVVENGQASIFTGPNGYLQWGTGNTPADPRFADPVRGDWHIGELSSAKNVGTLPSAYPFDAEGDPRIMGAPDIGGDESPESYRETRLYVIGKPAPGSIIRIGAVAGWGTGGPIVLGVSVSPTRRSPPLLLPYGVLRLPDPIWLVPLPPYDANGITGIDVPLAANFPPMIVQLQALFGGRLSNVVTTWIR